MTTMIAEVYDAAMADHEERFGAVDRQMAALRGDFAQLRGEFAELRGEVRALAARVATQQWVIGLAVALEIAILVKLFVH